MLLKEILVLSVAILSQSHAVQAFEEYFDESLVLRPLNDGRVAARFSFTSTLGGATPRTLETLDEEDAPQHYKLFPLSLGQVLREHAVTEMHLSMNSGKWDYQNWGYPDDAAVATGAELWAWMGDSGAGAASVDDRWRGLRNSLAGLFCASLGSLDDQRTTSPKRAFQPEGYLLSNQSYQIRHASLPSEHVCTENLTPFLKLLPCKSAAGIASLLNPHRLFDADWHGIGVHVWWTPSKGVSVQLSVQSVFDPVRLSPAQKRDFSLRTLFDRTITKQCPMTDSTVEVVVPKEGIYSISPEPHLLAGGNAVYNLNQDYARPFDISLRWPDESSFSYSIGQLTTSLTDLDIMRTLTGSTQSRGQLSVLIRNNLPSEMQVVYLETMPWLVQFYLHTMRLSVNGSQRNDLMREMSYTPPEAHGRPTLFEALLSLPPHSTLQFTMDVTKSFLRYTEHPPDAQRGWDLPPAVLVPLGLGPNESALTVQPRLQRTYTPTLLVDVATPDFSMPYNVIIMSSTLIALIFGSIFNLLTRKFVVAKS